MQYPAQEQGNLPPPTQTQYQQPTNVQSETVILQNTDQRKPKTYQLAHKQVTVHGVMHIVIGVICIIFNAVLIGVSKTRYRTYGRFHWDVDHLSDIAKVSPGIWGGICFILVGAFGLVAAKHKTFCFIITYMVLCICNAATTTLIVLGFGAGYLGEAESRKDNLYFDYNYNNYNYNNYNDYGSGRYTTPSTTTTTVKDPLPIYNTFIALGSLIVILSIIELVISIWSSALCCAAVCCCRESARARNQQLVAYHPGMYGQVVYINPNNPGTTFYNQGQQAYIQGQPVHNQGQQSYISNQGGVPGQMASGPTPPPGYDQNFATPPAYIPAPVHSSPSDVTTVNQNTPPASDQYQTKESGDMENI